MYRVSLFENFFLLAAAILNIARKIKFKFYRKSIAHILSYENFRWELLAASENANIYAQMLFCTLNKPALLLASGRMQG